MAEIISKERLIQQVSTGLITVQTDSRKIGQGDVFVPVATEPTRRRTFIADAIAKGAGYIVCEKGDVLEEAKEVFFVVVPNSREMLGELAGIRFGTQDLELKVVGVTGTNGKTTVTSLLEYIFSEQGRKAGVIGTVAYRWAGIEQPASMTTPDCLKQHALLARMEAASVENVFMEVSSHALDQNRSAGITFSGAVLTNLTQDHLDYHGDMEAYYQAKKKLFAGLPKKNKFCVINVDDTYGRRLCDELNGSHVVGFSLNDEQGCKPSSMVNGKILSVSEEGLHLQITHDEQEWELHSPMVGNHNASNLLAVIAVSLQMGLTPENLQCLSRYAGVSGRLERIPSTTGIHAFVDYAHTPDALVNVLSALRGAGFKRIITVFGCGGDRDKTKRPIMGEAVGEGSDVAVLTSDNPRTEDPNSILEDILPGLAKSKEVHTEVDREKAIALAVSLAHKGDCVLVAGKGHEDYQVIGTEKIPFSDQAILKGLLA